MTSTTRLEGLKSVTNDEVLIEERSIFDLTPSKRNLESALKKKLRSLSDILNATKSERPNFSNLSNIHQQSSDESKEESENKATLKTPESDDDCDNSEDSTSKFQRRRRRRR